LLLILLFNAPKLTTNTTAVAMSIGIQMDLERRIGMMGLKRMAIAPKSHVQLSSRIS
jgi:hypothetical protein